MASGVPVQSIDRLFDIIEELSSKPRGMTLTDLSSSAGLHISTTHRLLAALIARGYVQKDSETGKYRLTMRLFEVGSRAVSGINLVSVSHPFLERLADFTGETICLAARRDNEIVYLCKEDKDGSIARVASFAGTRSPMYCTAEGKAILAHLPEKEVKTIWSRTTIEGFTPHTLVTYGDLLNDLALTRTCGWAIDNEERELGVMCIAAPVFDFSSAPVAALSASFSALNIDEERRIAFVAQILASAHAITSFLGGPVMQI